MKLGYARESIVGESLIAQVNLLQKYSCDRIYQETISNVYPSRNKRTKFRLCIEQLRPGDYLVVTRLDRLTKSISDLIEISSQLKKHNIHLVILEENIDTSNDDSFFSVLELIGEFEYQLNQELIQEHRSQRLSKAKLRNIKLGPHFRLNNTKVEELIIERKSGKSIDELATKYNISISTAYRIISRYNTEVSKS